MLQSILNITGQPGLFKIISSSKNSLIVEDLQSHRRMPVHQRQRLISLGDIAMYTTTTEEPLGEILDKLYARLEGKPADVKAISANPGLQEFFATVLPDFDRERVYSSDIKKLLSWYNILLEAGYTHFSPEPEAEEKTDAESKPEE